MELSLSKFEQCGIHFDDLNRIRILDEETRNQAHELRMNCDDFIKRVSELKRISDSIFQIFQSVSQEVEREKIGAIGSMNLLRTSSKNREAQMQQMAALIMEKQLKLDRLTVELATLKNVEWAQNEFMDQFVLRR